MPDASQDSAPAARRRFRRWQAGTAAAVVLVMASAGL